MNGAIKSFFNTSGLMSGSSNPVLDIIQVGTISNTTTDLIPFFSYWERGRSAMIFSPTEIGKSGVVQAIEFAMDGPAYPTSWTAPRQSIWMGHLPIASYPALKFPSSTVQWDVVSNYSVSGFVRTYGAGTGANITYAMQNNVNPTWVQINMGGANLSQFNYNGTDGLIILYQNDQYPDNTSVGNAIDFYTSTSRANDDKAAYDYSYSSQSSTMSRIDFRPVVKLHVFG